MTIHYLAIAGISAIIAYILVTNLNVFVLIPQTNAEQSLVYKEGDLRVRKNAKGKGMKISCK